MDTAVGNEDLVTGSCCCDYGVLANACAGENCVL
jgi:hypothetical protein